MSHTPHQLFEEFPEYEQKIHDLKLASAHFSKLVDEYHAVNREAHRMEERIEPVDEPTEHTARKHRLALKDEIANMLRQS